MAARKKKVVRKPKPKANKTPVAKRAIRGVPTATQMKRAMKDVGGRNPRVGLKETPFRMRRSFRFVDEDSVRTIWDWYLTGCFSQAWLAAHFNLSPSVVGSICRCMPEDWGGKK